MYSVRVRSKAFLRREMKNRGLVCIMSFWFVVGMGAAFTCRADVLFEYGIGDVYEFVSGKTV